jgi:hypothetical protein
VRGGGPVRAGRSTVACPALPCHHHQVSSHGCVQHAVWASLPVARPYCL